MKWESDAEKAMDKVPFFVRRMAKRKVEDYVRQRGRDTVTARDVQDAKNAFAGNHDTRAITPAIEPPSQAAASEQPVAEELTLGNLTEDQIRRIEELVERTGGYESRFYSVKVCGGAVGCPLTMFDVQKMADEFKWIVDHSEFSRSQEGKVRGPVLSHHKLKVAVAGCPNSCSEPQIKDFAVVGVARPGPGPGDCTECGQCEAACKEGAVTVDGQPHIDRSLCVGCGDCAAACPTRALVIEKEGYMIVVGGKLGRRPQLATTLADLADEGAVYRALEASIRLLKEEGRGGERLGNVLNRVGLDELLRRLQNNRTMATGV